ncbi:hypothetical protein WAX74_01090 [Psychrobacillus sp. FJAT-51614]|uniref:Uncharacterized protein n=1 Tax=Psychrobacillus mangrovi TaxID=3117745 RepID=A0ABU8F1X3_9BACI
MKEQFEKDEIIVKEELHITYHFSILFTILGSLSIFLLLSNKVESLNLFIILLSITAGGLPLGLSGAFLDYKFSEIRAKNKKVL